MCCSCWQIRFLIKMIYFLRHGGNIDLTEPPCEAAACLPEARMALRDPSERTRSCGDRGGVGSDAGDAHFRRGGVGGVGGGEITPSVQLPPTSDTRGERESGRRLANLTLRRFHRMDSV